MEKQPLVLDPKKKLNIVKRYLHIMALLQNNKDSKNWNGSSLADILSLDEMEGNELSDNAVRGYINENLKKELGLGIETEIGGRRIELAEPIPEEILKQAIMIYSTFVIKDSTLEHVMDNYIRRHKDDSLWIMGRIYFAIMETKKISFTYNLPNKENLELTVNPYHMVIRNNNLYLVCKTLDSGRVLPFIMSRLDNLKILDDRFDEKIPSVSDIFGHSISIFISDKTYDVKLKFSKDLTPVLEDILSGIEHSISDCDDYCIARFIISDDAYLCKQLLLYGKSVEILEPADLREKMVSMLRESLGVYER
jgi:WYL domain-containing protein